MSAILCLAIAAHALAPLLPPVPPIPRAPATPSADVSRVQRDAWVMGTRARIVVEDAVPEAASRTAEAVLRELERVDALLSTWVSDSPLARLNGTRPGTPVHLEPELARLLDEAADWRDRTGGAFEPVVGALVDAWDLRGAGRTPTAQEVSDALAATGTRGMTLERGHLARSHTAAWIDSGAFGKGAALRTAGRDVVGERAGASMRILVDLGGQILASTPTAAPWPVRVAHPSERRRPVATLAVSRGSVATSGTSERGLHVLDPRTGRPVEAWGSVTVVHPDAFAADVLSTALYVLGPQAGLELAERLDVAALFLTEEAGHLSATWTPRLAPLLVDASDSSSLFDTAPRKAPQ